MKRIDPVTAWGDLFFGGNTRLSRPVLTRIFDRIPDAIVITDDDGRYLAANTAACDLLGYSREQLLQMRVADLVAPFEDIGAHFQQYRNLGKEKGEVYLRHANGDLRIAEYHAARLNDIWHISILRDITELRGKDDLLRIHQSALTHVNDAIVVTTADTDRDRDTPSIIWVNDAFCRMTGYEKSEVLGRSPRFLQGSETSVETRQRIQQALKNWQPVREELLNYRKDGTPFWVELDISPVPDATGWFTHWVAVQRDITERKEREATDALLKRRLREMIDALPQIAWIADGNGALEIANRRWYEYTGLPQETISTAEEAKDFIHPDDRTHASQYIDRLTSLREPFELEYRMRRFDGVYRWHLERSVPFLTRGGQVVQWVGTMTDIQDIKEQQVALHQSEERFALAVAGTQDGIWDADLETEQIYFSARWKEILGYVTPDEQKMISSKCSDFVNLLHPDDRAEAIQTIKDHLAGKTEHYRAEFRMRHRDGSYRWVETRGKALRRPDGVPYRFAGAHTDITEKKQAEKDLEETRRFIDRMAATTPDIFYLLDLNTGEFTLINQDAHRFFANPLSRRALSAEQIDSRLHPDDGAVLTQYNLLRSQFKDGEFAEAEYRLLDSENNWRWVLSRETPLTRDAAGNVTQILGVAQDITERKNAEEARRVSEERLLFALEAAQEGIWDWDIPQDTIFVTPSWLSTLGYKDIGPIISREMFFEILHPEDGLALQSLGQRFMEGENTFSMELRLRHREGFYVWLYSRGKVVARTPDGKVTRIVGSNLDITERKEMERSLIWRAQHDGLTGLPNRECIRDRAFTDIQKVLGDSSAPQGVGALLLLDLDGFKYVNDSLGHDSGDQVLIRTARRLLNVQKAQSAAHGIDICLSRIGGDEFALWMFSKESTADFQDRIVQIANVLLQALAEPLTIPLRSGNVREILLTGSIGIAVFPADGTDTEILFKNADTAMYQAKESGRGCYRFHTMQRSQAVSDRFLMENRLRSAIQHGELQLVYQPQIDRITGRIVSVEALARWRDDEMGNVSPSTFIPLAEETGMIHLLGEWTLRTACLQLRQWHEIAPDLRICVNLSALQVVEPGIVQVILNSLHASGLPGTMLELELTETALLRTGEHSAGVFLNEMRQSGVRLALDDFGTGYSSLSYLRSLPVDVVKIDRAFIQDLPTNAQTRAIVKAIIDLAHALELKVTAEGVETEDQKRILHDFHCDCLQGYLLARPVPPEELTRMLLTKQHLFHRSPAFTV